MTVTILTEIPSFYKDAAFAWLSQKAEIDVVCIARSSKERSQDFLRREGDSGYNISFLSDGDVEEQGSIRRTLNLLRMIASRRGSTRIICGWNHLEYWAAAFSGPRSKNILIAETSLIESRVGWIHSLAKRLFLKRISVVLVPGQKHADLITYLGFGGKVIRTEGVGVVEMPPKVPVRSMAGPRSRAQPFRAVFVGRLAHEKNIPILISAFKVMPECELLLVGDGPLRELIAASCKSLSNVKWAGYVERNKLAGYYGQADFLILPSSRETWGVVIQEALHSGLPVLLSNKVASATEYVDRDGFGLTFEPTVQGIVAAVRELTSGTTFAQISSRVEKFSLEEANDLYRKGMMEALREVEAWA